VDLVKLQPRSLELRAQTAAKLVELQREWRQYVNQNNVIELGYDNGYGYGPLDTTP
jgi:hypothetical protein